MEATGIKQTRQVATRWTCRDEVLGGVFFSSYFSVALRIIGNAQVGSSQHERRAWFGLLEGS